MKHIYAFLLLLFIALPGFATDGTKHSSTFVEKDIFQSAYFLQNVPGLIPDRKGEAIRYFAGHDGVCVFLTDHGLIYKHTQKDAKKIKEDEREREREKEHKHSTATEEEEEKFIPTRISYNTVTWIGANPNPQIEATGKNSGYYTFLAGQTDPELHSIVTDGYSKVTYRDLYPGIDVEYTFPDKGGVKYNLIVHPGADLSVVQLSYEGSIKKISKNSDGDIVIHTPTGDRIEHAPVSYTDDGQQVASLYNLQGSKVTFALPAGYDHSRTLIIDPWVTVVTQLTVRNLGIAVDYDITGNLFIYGAGGASTTDITTYHKLAKFDLSGNLLWVFLGNVGGIWNSAMGGYNYLSDAKVDKVSGKSYVGEGFNAGIGVQVIRLTTAGTYDNFISTPNSSFEEIWSFISDCSTGSMFAMGGGLNSDLNMGVINPISGVVSSNNVTGIGPTPYQQDIVSGAYDAYGSLYVILASVATFSVNNQIFKVNGAYNGSIWNVPSGYNSFNESANLPSFDMSGNGNTNNFNGLAANSSYLYYYDGANVKAFNLTTGAALGSTTIPGYTVVGQGGIAVDNCNHVYVGGQGVVKTFTFNGSTFTPGADIPLGAGFGGDAVNDVRYNSTNNLIYVAGSAVAGTFIATPSITCNVVNTFTALVTPTCTGASVQVTPAGGLINPVYSYLWQDNTGAIIKQTPPSSSLTDNISSVAPGTYTVQIQLNVNCGGAALTDTFIINCNNGLTVNDTSICPGQSAVLTAIGTPTGGTYLWMPGGATTLVSRSLLLSIQFMLSHILHLQDHPLQTAHM